jgi:hypothetical protein
MSANDYIYINRVTFEVEHRDYDTDVVLELVGKGKNLEEAVDIAKDFIDGQELPVEYGIYF